MWAGLPGPGVREQNAKRTFVACERDERAATELIDDCRRLREKMSWLRYTEVLDRDDDFASVDPNTVTKWIRNGGNPQLAPRFAAVFDGARPIDPGDPNDLDTAMASELWTDARLVSMATGMYARAGERASQWRAAAAALDKVLRRTMYRPTGRERALAEDLEDDLRKCGRWLSAMDRWGYVIHVHMAARLKDLSLHDALLQRYECIARIGPLAADAREYRNRIAAFVRKLGDFDGQAPYRLQRDSAKEFRASRRDLTLLLKEATGINDSFVREFTGDVSLDCFLFAHDPSSLRTRLPVSAAGRRLLLAWNEITTKAQWLYGQNLSALLELHERIEAEFQAQVGPIELTDEVIPDAILMDKKESVVEIDLEPDVIELEVDSGSVATDQKRE
jgi:hypothetical protein